ncbi:MAG TPA: isochorismatase family cysteine hydrolase [Magnetospirillaceae bacterium]|nr:isochorismatase family cysteine hydrolase [Magnetospirillaceae bacterium]
MTGPDYLLLVVDLQRYYVDPSASFRARIMARSPGVSAYIEDRIRSSVIPAVLRLKACFQERGWPVAYLRLCGIRRDRSDLHWIFRAAHIEGAAEGYADLYPLAIDPLAAVLPEIAPGPGDAVFDKTTFSGFASGGLSGWLERLRPRSLAFSGIATSQCVDTTARDASDRGFRIVHIEDAQADYGPEQHYSSLFASRGVCGGIVLSSLDFCGDPA